MRKRDTSKSETIWAGGHSHLGAYPCSRPSNDCSARGLGTEDETGRVRSNALHETRNSKAHGGRFLTAF